MSASPSGGRFGMKLSPRLPMQTMIGVDFWRPSPVPVTTLPSSWSYNEWPVGTVVDRKLRVSDKPKSPKQQAVESKRIKKHVNEALDHNAAIRRELQAVMEHIRQQTPRAPR
jgi:hypothetical protein